MSKLLIILSLSVGLFAAMPAAPAEADFGMLPQLNIDVGFDSTTRSVSWSDFVSWLRGAITDLRERMFGGSDDGVGSGPSGASVPELDMTVAGSAIVLLIGGVAYFASRRREQE